MHFKKISRVRFIFLTLSNLCTKNMVQIEWSRHKKKCGIPRLQVYDSNQTVVAYDSHYRLVFRLFESYTCSYRVRQFLLVHDHR